MVTADMVESAGVVRVSEFRRQVEYVMFGLSVGRFASTLILQDQP